MNNIVEMNNITKTFPGIIANDDVTIALREGEILALLGENGAGKSTLMSVLFGMYQPDSGQIVVKGEPVVIQNPKDATEHDIGMVHQHFKLVHNYTVTQNIILGVETVEKGVVKLSDARKEIIKLSKQYNLNVDPDAKIEDISIGMQVDIKEAETLKKENAQVLMEPTEDSGLDINFLSDIVTARYEELFNKINERLAAL